MKNIIIYIFIFFFPFGGYCQYEEIEFETDSTKIELTKNSVYRIWEETYKRKDSIFYSVRYIKDTTQVHIEGWKRTNGQYFGEWSEYKIDGTWLYTIDYTNHTWRFNKEEFKFQLLKDSMKANADKILIEKFGREFFNNNIVFNFYGHTYIGKWETYDTGTFWMQDKYLGSWVEPINQKPNSYVLDYTIKIGDDEFYDNMLRIELDSSGNLLKKPSRFEIPFEEIIIPQKTKFNITKSKALELCNLNKIEDIEVNNYESALRFERRKMAKQPGEYYYQVVSFVKEEIEGDCPKKCLIKRYYYVWRFNPWTSDVTQKNKMVQYSRWSNGHGVTGDYEEINK